MAVTIKTEYETAYKVSIFSDYNVLMQYAERFGSYLRSLMQEHPLDVDVVCALATVEQVLRHEENSIQLLEDFLETYSGELSDTDKARVYTNLAFYYNDERHIKEYDLSNDYEISYGYAVCLFELKKYEKAKTIFKQLLLKYPNRMRLLLGIAYCDVYLGNKKQALDRLKKIKLGSDVAYYLSNDEIYDFDIF